MSNIASGDNRQSRTQNNLQNREELRQKVFDERKALVAKWFDKWNDSQRLTVIEDLVTRSTIRQLDHLNAVVSQHKPVYRDDFTRVLPRAVSLHVFSFLDPRSLCRSAQVSWYWKTLVEIDVLWKPLCQRLDWTLSYTPSPFEKTAWKSLYIDNVVSLKRTVNRQTLQTRRTLDLERLSLGTNSHKTHGQNSRPKPLAGIPLSDQRPPWKGSDPTPRDTWRNNYLENEDNDDDTDEKLNRLKRLEAAAARHRIARSRLRGSTASIRQRSNSLTRSKSATFFGNGSNFMHETSPDPSVWRLMVGGAQTLMGGAPFLASHSYIGPTTGSAAFATTNQSPVIARDKLYDTTVY